MIELLVVIAIIALLTTLVVTGASSALDAAKKRNTLQVMQNGLAAIEVFASENPLGGVYNAGPDPGFGNLPPYQLARGRTARFDPRWNRAPQTLPELTGWGTELSARQESLSLRLFADLSGRNLVGLQSPPVRDLVRFSTDGDGHDDARALSTYLSVFSPRALDALPPSSMRPLNPREPEYINPRGTAGNPGDPKSGWRDLNVLHDGWGVPLNYFMYVKIGVGVRDNGRRAGPRIIDRRPVLMSRGVDREFYDEWAQQGSTLREDPRNWMFSEPLPTPVCDKDDVTNKGRLNGKTPVDFRTGWVRLIADENRATNSDEVVNDQPGYLPEYDPAP
jgi:hypothetical protein